MAVKSEDIPAQRAETVDMRQIVPLLLATTLLTVGLSMFLSGTTDGMQLVQPVIVVFGGTVVALLATFPLSQLAIAGQVAINRGIRGGTLPEEMVRALMKVCDVSRRDGLLGVAEVQTNSSALNNACQLIANAANEQSIHIGLQREIAQEQSFHKGNADVFLFTALYAVLIGGLGTIIRAIAAQDPAMMLDVGNVVGVIVLPLVCGVTLALLMAILVGRLRAAHVRELMVVDIAYQGAALILEDNNVQRLRARLLASLPAGAR